MTCPEQTPPDYFPRRYCLLCPELTQIQYPSPYDGNLLDFFANQHDTWLNPASWLWSTLARPVAGVEHVQAHHPKYDAVPAAIERLPNELLDQILDLLEERKTDILALGLSSAVVWRLVLYRVHREYERSSGIWIGKRVFYQGQGDFTMLPPVSKTNDSSEESQAARYDHARQQLQMYPDFIRDNWMKSVITKTAAEQWTDTLESAKEWDTFSPSDWKKIKQDLSPPLYPQDRIWVLRNLTTSEYIRSDKLEPSPQHHLRLREQKQAPLAISQISKLIKQRATLALKGRKKDPTPETSASDLPFNTSPLTFAQIFLVLTCQSRLLPWGEHGFMFQDGRWSGHCFDIVTLETHSEETHPLEWADVSELAVDDVANLRFWVQQLEGGKALKGSPRHAYDQMSFDRMQYHAWEGLDTESETAKPSGRWSLKNPMQRGFLVSVQQNSSHSSRTRNRRRRP